MLDFGLFGILNPWLLTALAALPVVWWLTKVTPPAAREVQFPALRLLLDLRNREETPNRTPWWLLLLRLVIAALVILACADPVLNPRTGQPHGGPLLVVIDDDWAAAAHWEERLALLEPHLDQAVQAGRSILILTTAPTTANDQSPPKLLAPSVARERIRALTPKPWTRDRKAALARLAALPADAFSESLWLDDGLDGGSARAFGEALAARGPVTRLDPPGAAAVPLVLGTPKATITGFKVTVGRPVATGPARVTVLAHDNDGTLLAQGQTTFGTKALTATVTIDAPTEVRNKVTRLNLAKNASAATVHLLDNRWRRRLVGIVTVPQAEEERPLISEGFYLNRALAPFAEVKDSDIAQLLAEKPSVIILPDAAGQVPPPLRRPLDRWLDDGGLLLRFAGPRLAAGGDDLVPVPLRKGDRALDGALSWTKPARIAPFPPTSPFAGLTPPPDVRIERQVLAEPSLDLERHSWARLTDGTPLVTYAKRGRGLLVLVHTSANTLWSNLAISGLYVEMLRRLIALGRDGALVGERASLPPYALLDAKGQLLPAGPETGVLALKPANLATTVVGPRHPPGYYGDQAARRALNLTLDPAVLKPIPAVPGIMIAGPEVRPEVPLLGSLLGAALVLTLLDSLAGLALSGRLALLRRRTRLGAGTAIVAVAAALLAMTPGEQARAADLSPAANVAELRLAYVVTGDQATDRLSRDGLVGLSAALRDRTSVEPGAPVGVDLATDELSFYPLIYWPMTAGQAVSNDALQRLSRYMKHGGMVLFDTQDANFDPKGTLGAGPGTQVLRATLAQLDVPPLIPVPPTHVLTKAFYLLQTFPGRYESGQVWVERNANPANDGVSSFIIGSNDWAAAWAVDQAGRPEAALEPGGPRQRELALRFGINLVMYALTGNYKADQVHVPTLLERLGQ